MSRIGDQPVKLNNKIEASVDKKKVTIKGPKGELMVKLPYEIAAEIKDGSDGKEVVLTRSSDEKKVKALHGTYRALVANAVEGVENPYAKKLEIVGVGYRGKKQGTDLTLSLGYTHPVIVPIPDGLEVDMPDEVTITVQGVDKQLVGQFAAKVRGLRKPEPYKGKGIRYSDEVVRRKSAKAALVGAGEE